MKTICFHGAESTGKSVLAAQLQAEFGWNWVAEYGRAYCEEHGTDLIMSDLLAIAEGQDRLVREAAALVPDVLILDTDPLMTAAWAQMLFGEVPDAMMAYAKADYYLLFDADVPWVPDGTRFFGTADERAKFAGLAEDMLVRAKVPYTRISGDWAQRKAGVVAAIADIMLSKNRSS